jgi:hypothetical protein
MIPCCLVGTDSSEQHTASILKMAAEGYIASERLLLMSSYVTRNGSKPHSKDNLTVPSLPWLEQVMSSCGIVITDLLSLCVTAP